MRTHPTYQKDKFIFKVDKTWIGSGRWRSCSFLQLDCTCQIRVFDETSWICKVLETKKIASNLDRVEVSQLQLALLTVLNSGQALIATIVFED